MESTLDAPPPLTYQPSIVTRRLFVPGLSAEQDFQFAVIDSAEAWPEASQIRSKKLLPLGPGKKLQIDSSGISWDDYVAILQEPPIPEWPVGNTNKEPDEAFLALREAATLDRRVLLIERATQKKIPGATKEDKRCFLKSRTAGEVEALMQFVNSDACCWSDLSLSTEMIERYRAACNANAEIISLSDTMDEGSVSTESKYTFHLQRPGDSFISEFHLSGMAREEAIRIRKDCHPGDPPLMPQRNEQGRPIGTTPNPNDPLYQIKVRKSNKRELLLYLQSCMAFPIPGNTEEDRSAWLGKRLIGDLTLLKEFIESNILSAEGSIQSF